MKKKFTLEIASPCSENFDKMIPNSEGSFCDSCMKNVIDLSKKTNSEVAKFISKNKGKNICARVKTTQLEEEFEYNETLKINNFKYAALTASVLLVSNISAQEKTPVTTEISAPQINNHTVGKIAYRETKEVKILVKGKLLEAKTNKTFDTKKYPNLTINISGAKRSTKVNPKTGEFSISIVIVRDAKSLAVTITSGDYYLSKIIDFDIKTVKNNTLLQDIIIEEIEFPKVETLILGGLGINYSGK